MLHPHTELRFINPELGYGVVATQLIPIGTVTWVRDSLDQAIAPERVAALPPVCRAMFERHATREHSGHHILSWDVGIFVNHSCSPTCLDPSSNSTLEVAVRDIHPGEQMTNDYAHINLQHHEAFDCRCDSPACRKWITPEDAVTQAEAWRNLLHRAGRQLMDVPQPLLPLMKDCLPDITNKDEAFWKILDYSGYLSGLLGAEGHRGNGNR